MRQKNSSVRRAATLADVARAAGVSKSTAAQAYNGSGRLSEATREHVLRVARELDYRPNALAHSLRSQRTNIIGFYSPFSYAGSRNPFLGEILGGLQEGCEAHSQDLLIYRSFVGRDGEAIFRELTGGIIDGLIIQLPREPHLAERLAASHLPVVAIADPNPHFPAITVDDAAGSQMTADYLAVRGVRRVLYRRLPDHATSLRRRFESFEIAAQKHAMQVLVSWAQNDGSGAFPLLPEEIRLLEKPPHERPQAIVCSGDVVAYSLIRTLEKMQLRVPHDISIISFDGIASPHDLDHHFTSVRAPWPQVAQRAVDELMLEIAAPLREKSPREIQLPIEWLPGDTA